MHFVHGVVSEMCGFGIALHTQFYEQCVQSVDRFTVCEVNTIVEDAVSIRRNEEATIRTVRHIAAHPCRVLPAKWLSMLMTVLASQRLAQPSTSTPRGVSGQLQAAAGGEIRVCFFSMLVSLSKESAESAWSVHNLLLQIGFQSWCEGTFEDGCTAMGIMT